MRVVALYLSAGHNFFGRHGMKAGTHPVEEVAELECVKGKGLRGDRFFAYKADYKGQITFFADEVYEEMGEHFGRRDRGRGVFRRNVITRGVDLNDLVGVEFEVQGVRFSGTEECRPCHWMDEAYAPGAEAFLKGRGGLRAKILSDGVLRKDG